MASAPPDDTDRRSRLKALIAEIAATHGVALSPDDPLLILPTINTILLDESRQAQEAALREFQSELEAMSGRWSIAINTKAEAVLNAALEASETAFHQRMVETAATLTADIAEKVNAGFSGPLADARAVANRNLVASALSIAAAIIVLVAVLLLARG